MSGPADPELPSWLVDPALGVVWERVRRRLESTGLEARGAVTVEVSERAARHAVAALLGEPVPRQRFRVDLAGLDARLAERSGMGGLVEVLGALSGAPLRDRRQERAALEARRDGPLELAGHLVSAPWADAWVAGLRSTGLLTRRPEALEVVRQACAVLGALVDLHAGSDAGPDAVALQRASPAVDRSRVELAATVVGDAHALDEDRLLHAVVLRGLAAAAGVPLPTSARERRALWQSFGVSLDLVSSTCLTLGVVPEGGSGLALRLRTAADAGDPVHLTAWDLRHWPVPASGAGGDDAGSPVTVLVCENPRVLEAVAQDGATTVPVVCTSGEPNTVVTGVLDRLAARGARLLYHGDLDWPGIAIANRLVERHGVVPWRMTVEDYRDGLGAGSPPLRGLPVAPVWDAGVGEAMAEEGRAVHEEAVLDSLLVALAGE